MNIETKIEELRKEFNSKLDEILKAQFEVGKWYKTELGSIYFISKIEKEDLFGYGLDSDNVWFDNTWLCEISDIKSLATPKEVEEALIKEAEKRGFKDNVNIIELNMNENRKLTDGCFIFRFLDNDLYFGGSCIYKNGKWAEIVKTKTIDEIVEEIQGSSSKDKKEYFLQNKQDIINALNNL